MNLSDFLKNKNYDSELKNILLSIQSGSIEIYKKINEENNDILGSSGQKNIQNEEVQKLDIIANDIFINRFSKNTAIHSILSEENENVIDLSNSGKYLIAMDPLDGSSNIDVNVSVGTIFSIYRRHNGHKVSEKDFLQKGDELVASGYVIYGSSTIG